MTGSTKDPANGPEVAASVFAAVIVYAVRLSQPHDDKYPPLLFTEFVSNSITTSFVFNWGFRLPCRNPY